MKKIFVLAFVISISMAQLVSAQTPSAQDQQAQDSNQKKQENPFPNVKKLSTKEVDEVLEKHPHAVLLDVRKPEEAAKLGTFRGAVNIPIDQLEQRLGELSKDHLIVPFSNHAARAAKAADLLKKHGYKVAGAAGVQTYAAEGGTKYLVPAVTAQK